MNLRTYTEKWNSTFEDHHNQPIPFIADITYTSNPDASGWIVEQMDVEVLEFTTENQDSIRESLGYLISEFFHNAKLVWNCTINFK